MNQIEILRDLSPEVGYNDSKRVHFVQIRRGQEVIFYGEIEYFYYKTEEGLARFKQLTDAAIEAVEQWMAREAGLLRHMENMRL